MNDTFKEQLVKKMPSSDDTVIKVSFYILAIILTFVSVIIFPQVSFFVLLVGLMGAHYLGTLRNVEYEYTLTNSDIDIDYIYNRSKRKRAISFKLSEIEKIDVININEQIEKNVIKMDLSTGIISNDTYRVIVNKDGKRYRIIMEPCDVILTSMKRRR